jgi:hypothetical protein
MNTPEVSSEDFLKLMTCTSRVAELSNAMSHLMGVAITSAKQGDFNKPNLYNALANTLAGISDNVSRINEVKAKYEGIEVDNMVDAWGVGLDVTSLRAANHVFAAYGVSTGAVDRTLVAPAVIFALNEVSITVAEDLPFPDDASPEQVERAETMKAHAEQVRQEFEDLMGQMQGDGPLSGEEAPADEPTIH